MQVTNQLH